MDKIEQIKAEIERRIKKHNEKAVFKQGYREGLTQLLSFINSLPEEKPRDKTCRTCVFYENDCPFVRGKFMPYPNIVCKDYTEEQPSKDLEKAANARYPEKRKYNKKATGDYDANLPRRKAFIAGVQWQKEQMEKQAEKALAKDGITLADMVAYNKGVAEGRRMEKEETNEIIQDAIDHANKCYWQSIEEDKDLEIAYYWGGGEDCLRALQRDIK